MKTKVIYLKGNESDAELLNAQEGFKLQSVVHCQGQIVGYMVREPWLQGDSPSPLVNRGVPIETQQLPADAFVTKPAFPADNGVRVENAAKAAAQEVAKNKHKGHRR